MSNKHLILATSGHVDHGKSSLVRALTGTDPDRLPEEKLRGITIDLGFASLELPVVAGPGPEIRLGIVDVPGHEDFVRNMVAGVGSIDLALLVVASDDGWMPQTEEHLQILEYLGVRHGVVAVTKSDLAPDLKGALAGVRSRLMGSILERAPVVPTTIHAQASVEALKAALRAVALQVPESPDIGKPRLPLDRVFVLHGVGTVATGTLNGGNLAVGQAVVVQPHGRAVRLRGVQVHGRDVRMSGPGCRTAVNIPDLKAGVDLHRGDVITLPDMGTASVLLDVQISRSGRLDSRKSGPGRLLRTGTRVRIHLATSEVPARIQFTGGLTALPAGESAVARLRLEKPLFVFAGDHFIIRDWAQQCTLGGGVVLDPTPNPRTLTPERLGRLQSIAAATEDGDRFVEYELSAMRATQIDQVGLRTRFSSGSVAAAINQLIAQGKIVKLDGWVAEAAWWRKVIRLAVDAIDRDHRQRPERLGLPLSDLKAALAAELPASELFPFLLTALAGEGYIQSGAAIRSSRHAPSLPAGLQAAGVRLRTALSSRNFDPPSRKELAPDSVSQQALRFLIQTGEAVELGEEVVLFADHYNKAAEIIRRHIRDRGPSTASDLRQALGTSRRIVIPLLERMDKEGITRRDGDRRILR